MQPRRNPAEDDRNDSCEKLLVTSETLRSASHRHPKSEASKSSDERISLFWRIFGGTILSIVALVVITAYQSISSSIHDLRTDLARANEARADLVKKDEYSAARTKIWDHFQEIQKEQQTLLSPVAQMQQRVEKLEEEAKAEVADRRETHELHATIKERLAQLEQQLATGRATQKDVQTLQQLVAGLQEKSNLRDQQFQQAQEDRKELVKEIQSLRERLAKVETATALPMTKTNVKGDSPN